jgi:uncharacterized protein (DUF433 family)
MQLPAFLTRDVDDEIRLTGHRIGLYTVVREYKEGRSAEQIAAEYPSLPLELVRQVIAFYLDNRSEVDAYVAAYRADLERQAAAPPGPGVLRIRQLMEKIQQGDQKYGRDPSWSSLSAMEKLRRLERENHAETG